MLHTFSLRQDRLKLGLTPVRTDGLKRHRAHDRAEAGNLTLAALAGLWSSRHLGGSL